MSTADEMLDQILMDLSGFVTEENRLAQLSGSLAATADAISVKNNVVLEQSVVEIGSELVYVGSVNQTTGAMTNCIRGYRGTTAAAYTDGQVIRSNPRITRAAVQRALDDTIRNLAPRLVAIAQTSISPDGSATTYNMPTGTLDVVSVQYSLPGSWGLKPKSRRWRYNRDAATQPTIDLYEFAPGCDVLVTYSTEPATISGSDDFEDTGLPYWCEPLVRAGAVARLVQFFDAANYTAWSASQHNQNSATPVGGSMKLTQFMLANYEDQLQKASIRQRREWDTLTHYTG